MFDYEVLRIIWWVLLGVLLCGFAIMDGFDLGVAALLPLVAKNDVERRVTINTVGPVWEGNQVWLILGGGAIFAAWPILYAVAFSGFYLAMLLVLLFVGILRPVAFKFRSKMPTPLWRANWDRALCLSGFVSALLFGVAVGNVLQGVPFHFDDSLRAFYTGSFFALLNPFALLCGIVSVAMLIMHGGLYLAIKTEAPIAQRAANYAGLAAILVMSLFAIGGLWTAFVVKGFVLHGEINHFASSNPLHKQVGFVTGAWMNNYKLHPWMVLAPSLGFAGALVALFFKQIEKYRAAFIASSLSIFGIITTVGVSMFPFILPSSSNPNMSLIVWDASSSQLTLGIMLIAVVVFLPIVLAYTTWVFRVLRGKVTEAYIRENDQATY